MKIRQHPRMKDITVGDEVLCYRNHLYARVEEVFPAAVCVKLVSMDGPRRRLTVTPQLWRAEEIENLSVCRYCGGREDLVLEHGACVPSRVCRTCQSVLELSLADVSLTIGDHQPPKADH
jgi:hypothetical protein